MKLTPIVQLIRIRQWYKNLVVFLPLIFGQQLFNTFALGQTVLGFIALCLISSVNYVINDIVDKNRDKKDPEKRNRPIPSKKISLTEAVLIALVMFIASITLSLNLSSSFVFFTLALFVSTQLYSFWLKHEVFADILLISTNFVLRTVAGAFVITVGSLPYVSVSMWLVLPPFFLALFLATSKRRAELYFLKESAPQHRLAFEIYDKKLIDLLMVISASLLISSYSLYTFFSEYNLLIISLPILLYIVFSFFTKDNLTLAMRPEMMLVNKKFLSLLVLMAGIAFTSIYIYPV